MSDAQTVAAADPAGMLGDILAMPDHILDAQWRAESAMLQPIEAQSLFVCGIGGSAIGADLAVAALGRSISKPIHVVRGYDVPSWATADSAILLSSYSGSTEETLSCYKQAERLGAPTYVVSSGGELSELAHAAGEPVIGLPGIFQPRAAVAYGIVSTIEIAIATGIADAAVRADLVAAADHLRVLGGEWGPEADDDALPKRLARAAHGKLPQIYGAELTAPVAYRWRCQINENAKQPATSFELPESNHNEICSWESASQFATPVAWFLRDAQQSPRVRQRIKLTAKIATEHGAETEIVDTDGATRSERLFESVFLGDLMSLYLAVERGVDPTPVPTIENLKDALGRPGA